MKKIHKVKIYGFWGDKIVSLDFNENVNFLIGVNGSGKTTIINLIAASLNADAVTLESAQFSRIKIDFFGEEDDKGGASYIEIDKSGRKDLPYYNITYKIKLPGDAKNKTFRLNDIDEELLLSNPSDYYYRRARASLNIRGGQVNRDVNIALQSLVNLTWLSVHRVNRASKSQDEKSFESSVDQKIKELSINLVKYFGILDKQYSFETEKFQKNIFLSLIEDGSRSHALKTDDLDSDKEMNSLRQVFLLFKLKESEFGDKLSKYFSAFDSAKKEFEEKKTISIPQLSYLLGTRRIHSIVQEWAHLNERKTNINKPKVTFIDEINSLFQHKEIYISDKNELLVKTDNGRVFPLFQLSSGEKQLLIILGEGLLQENSAHIYIADEPELSLHVDWQEKLVSSLKNINPNSQIVFATHSPDIVGPFSDSVIQIEGAIS